ncbi:unnamed protein product [Spirodela intermedia]|uniref:Chloride channel protein n=1 Tax=Spirodela intermedia TaxID=51605 RepID=A0A7I8JDY3_SPIIN|nr:unnamed protein product [Spirodela intermedia]CAA6668364.1 unnamed protein product [Spirodela intermedia]
MDAEREEGGERDLEEPLLKRSPSLTTSHLAMVGSKVSRMESLDYEIIENDLFQHDWRSRSRVEVLQYVFLKWTLAFLVGLLTGAIASLINLAVENIAGAKMIAVTRLVNQQRYLAGVAYLTGINLALTAIAAVLCVGIAPTAAGPGIPEIKAYLNGVDTPNMYGASTLFVKIVGSIGAVAAGLDLGKEGPLVHIGTCIAALLGQGGGGAAGGRRRWRWLRYIDNDRDRRDLITLGASSGSALPSGRRSVAALLWRTFFSTAVVVVVLRGFTELCDSGSCGLFGRGGLILFDVGDVQVTYHAADLLPVAAIGVIGGLLGSLYNFLLHKVLRFYSLINDSEADLEPVGLHLHLSVRLLVAISRRCTPCDAGLPAGVCPTTSRTGKFKQFNCAAGYYNDLASLLQSTNDDAPAALLVFFALYCVLGLFTFGIAVPSGLFLPIILMGSGYGRLLGLAMKPYTQLDQGLYAVLGAAALMAGSMRMTVSLCVIFLELTNNLLLLPITMIVLLIAKTVGDVFNPSIYEIILELKGLPFLEPNPEPWMRNLTVGELAAAKPAVVSLSGVERVGRLLEVLNSTTHNGFPVVDHRPKAVVAELHGLVLRSHIIAVLRKRWFLGERRRTEEWEARERFTSEDLAERGRKEMFVDLHPFTNLTPHTVVETMSVAKAVVLFREIGLRHLLIVPKNQGPGVAPLVGILTRQDLRAHNILGAFPHISNRKARRNRDKASS